MTGVRFSKKYTLVNMVVSAVGFVGRDSWYYYNFSSFQIAFSENYYQYIESTANWPWFFGAFENREASRASFFLLIYLPLSLSSYLIIVILTLLFLYLDLLPCCCSWTRVPGEEISVYDPTTDKRFVLKDGELVDPPEKDVETGNTPFSLCGCCSGTVDVEEQNSGDIALRVEK